MAFLVPTFNITCNWWDNDQWRSNWPDFTAIPTIADLPCQLRPGCKFLSPFDVPGVSTNLHELVLPKLTNVVPPYFDDGYWVHWCGVVEVPSNSGRYYFLHDVVDVAKGFLNEYRVAILSSTQVYESAVFAADGGQPYAPPWPIPIP